MIGPPEFKVLIPPHHSTVPSAQYHQSIVQYALSLLDHVKSIRLTREVGGECFRTISCIVKHLLSMVSCVVHMCDCIGVIRYCVWDRFQEKESNGLFMISYSKSLKCSLHIASYILRIGVWVMEL